MLTINELKKLEELLEDLKEETTHFACKHYCESLIDYCKIKKGKLYEEELKNNRIIISLDNTSEIKMPAIGELIINKENVGKTLTSGIISIENISVLGDK